MLGKRWVGGVFAGVLILGLLAACGKDRPAEKSAEQPAAETRGDGPASPAAPSGAQLIGDPSHIPLAVYRFDPQNGHLYVTQTIEITPNLSRGEAARALLERVNGTLSGRRIQWAGVERSDEGSILVVDLVDAEDASAGSGWHNAFQGSSGGTATQGFLAATFLQPVYRGDWYDGVRFLLNGQQMSEMDHVNLSGVFLRSQPMAGHLIASLSEPGSMSAEEISEYLRNMLALPDDARINLVRVRPEDGTPWTVFFTSSSVQMVRRGVLRVVDGVPRILRFEEDHCNCFGVSAEAKHLVRGRGEFVVTRFSPLGGTCVGSDVVRILALTEEGSLEEVWRGTSFEADGSRSRLASVEFVDADGDGDLEIVRRGKLIDCGDDCLCREGPVLETFETLFKWSPEKGRYVEAP